MTGPRRKLGRHKHKRLDDTRRSSRTRTVVRGDVLEPALRRCTPVLKPILRTLRRLIHDAVPQADEALVDGTPTWLLRGRLCDVQIRRGWLELVFPRGAQLSDPTRLLVDGDGDERLVRLEHRRDIHPRALKALVRQAARLPPPG